MKLLDAVGAYLRVPAMVRMVSQQGSLAWRVRSCMGWWVLAAFMAVAMPAASAWGSSELGAREDGVSESAGDHPAMMASHATVGLMPQYGHYIHLGLSAQRADVRIYGRGGLRLDVQTFDLLGVQFHYSYQSVLTEQLSYFVGTGMAVLAPSTLLQPRTDTSLPLSYNIPSIWLGLLIQLHHKFKVMFSGEYGLRQMYPLSVHTDRHQSITALGLKTNDYEVMVHGQYDLSARRALFVAVAKEWLRYQPQKDISRRIADSPLQWVEFRMDAWKLSGGWVYHF